MPRQKRKKTEISAIPDFVQNASTPSQAAQQTKRHNYEIAKDMFLKIQKQLNASYIENKPCKVYASHMMCPNWNWCISYNATFLIVKEWMAFKGWNIHKTKSVNWYIVTKLE
jgi:hypothetical protein